MASYAQQLSLQFVFNASNSLKIEKEFSSKKVFDNEIDLQNSIQNSLQQLKSVGYLASSVDSLVQKNNEYFVYVFLGEMYQWNKIHLQNIPKNILSAINVSEQQFKNEIISQKKLVQFCEKILNYCDNNGYPFAQVYLDSFYNKQHELCANLVIEKNNFIHIDSIDIQGDVDISDQFLYRYINIKPGDVYNESLVKKISTRLREINFLQEERPWRMSFSISKNILTLYLKNKDANRADILVGLLPNNNALGGKFLLTGDIKLALVNSLRAGEAINLNWQNLQYKSPRLIMDAMYPYAFGTALGISGKFLYTKNDSSFKNVLGEVGVQYNISANQFVKTYWHTSSSDIITVDTFFIKQNNKLPNNIDLKVQTFGIELQQNKTDNKLNPRKGFQYILNANLGIKNIVKNNTIQALYNPNRGETYNYLYDSLSLKSYRYSVLSVLSYYLPLGKRFTSKWQYSGGLIYNQNIFKNELYQIGGYRLMRGFDEASLFVNQYHVFSLEPRFLLSQNSYLFMFQDVGVVSSPYFDASKNKTALGLGAGISLETKNGMFNFMYALGNNLGSGIEFKNSKIHFGYVNSF